MTKTLRKVCDFTIRITMIFTTLLVLIYFAGKFGNNSFVFGTITLVYILAIIIKGIIDIFSKE